MKRYLFILPFLFLWNWLNAQDSINSNGYNIFYHPNGVISSEGNMVNGQPDGWWKAYNDNGILSSEGNRKNQLLDSTWTFYSQNGEKSLIINYKEGKKNGARVQFFEDGFMVENWDMDTLVGAVNTYFADSVLKKSTPYEEGKAHGLEKEFNREGLVTAVTNFYRGVMTRREFINRTDKFGFKQGNWKFFWENGKIGRASCRERV